MPLRVASQEVETAPIVNVLGALRRKHGLDEARARLNAWLEGLTVLQKASLLHHWPAWARPKQMPKGDFVSWGFLTGRGFGKTYGISKWIVGEIQAGRASMIGLAAQDEQNTIALQVLGPSGLFAASPPRFKPSWDATKMWLVWPNGAKAIARTPEVPGKIRGFDYDLTWITELQSWPASTREEALSNFRIATRIGLARMIWDATPKRKHPLLLEMLADNKRDPRKYVVVRGTTHENAINLSPDYIAELERKYGGTSKGREELLGEMLEDADGAIFRQRWIDAARRPMPDALLRRIISIDPAVTERAGSDTTGIIEAGLGVDQQVLVIADDSGKHAVGDWADRVLRRYVERRCDLIVAETNKGGDLITQNIRSAAQAKGLRVVVVGKDEKPRHVGGVVHVKEVYARGAKEDRAQPAAVACERGRISHVAGADLSSLEETLTTWEPKPGAKSPGDLDAYAHAVNELLDLNVEVDNKAGFAGLTDASRVLAKPSAAQTGANLAALLRVGPGRI